MNPVIDVQVEAPFEEQVDEALLGEAARATLAQQGVEEPVEMTVVIVGDETIQALNRRFRDVDAPTDVLAFPHETRGPFVGAPGLPRYLGDVVISYPRAEAQAQEAGHPVEAELRLLVVHGVLHLLGHDHADPEEKARMWAAQEAVLRRLGYRPPTVDRRPQTED